MLSSFYALSSIFFRRLCRPCRPCRPWPWLPSADGADSAEVRKVPSPSVQGDQRPLIHSGKSWGKGDKVWVKGYLWFTFTGTSTSGILRHHDGWTVKGTSQVYQGTGHLAKARQGKAGREMSSTICDACLVIGPILAQISKHNQSTGGPRMLLHHLTQKRVLNLFVKKKSGPAVLSV